MTEAKDSVSDIILDKAELMLSAQKDKLKIDTNTQRQNLRDFLEMEQQGMFKGARASTTPAPLANIDYLYDFNSIFANPTQEGLFSSPYSTTTRNKAAAGGFVRGGQVEDKNDILLKMIKDM